jgi:hypothetical protein
MDNLCRDSVGCMRDLNEVLVCRSRGETRRVAHAGERVERGVRKKISSKSMEHKKGQ